MGTCASKAASKAASKPKQGELVPEEYLTSLPIVSEMPNIVEYHSVDSPSIGPPPLESPSIESPVIALIPIESSPQEEYTGIIWNKSINNFAITPEEHKEFFAASDALAKLVRTPYESEDDAGSDASIEIALSFRGSRHPSFDGNRSGFATPFGPGSPIPLDLLEDSYKPTNLSFTPDLDELFHRLTEARLPEAKPNNRTWKSMDKYAHERGSFGSAWGKLDHGTVFEITYPDGKGCLCGANDLDIVTIAASRSHIIGVTKLGEVFGCGQNLEGQIKHDQDDNQINSLVIIDSLITYKVVSVSCSQFHTCVLTVDGKAITFGENSFGQLGHSYTMETRVPPGFVTGVETHFIKQAACGNKFTMLLTSAGEVFTMGDPKFTGHESKVALTQATRIEKIFGIAINFIAAGDFYAFVVSVPGEVFAWGQNKYKQLGLDHADFIETPTKVQKLQHISQIACGESHTLFLQSSGKLYGAGANVCNQLGIAKHDIVCPPMVLKGISGAIQIACGQDHSVILTRNGKVICMGKNNFNQLGYFVSEEFKDINLVEHPKGPCGRRVFFICASSDTTFMLSSGKTTNLPQNKQSLDESTFEPNFEQSFSFPTKVPTLKFVSTRELINMAKLAQVTGNTDKLLDTIKKVFSSPTLMNGSFYSDTSVFRSKIDFNELENFYSTILEMNEAIITTLITSSIIALETFETTLRASDNTNGEYSQLSFPSAIRLVMITWMCSVVENLQLSTDFLLKLSNFFTLIPMKGRECIRTWIAEDCSAALFEKRIFKPIKQILDELAPTFESGYTLHPIIAVMDCLYAANEDSEHIPFQQFYNGTISNLPPPILLNDLETFKRVSSEGTAFPNQFFFCSRPYLLDVSVKKRLLRDESKIEQDRIGLMNALASMFIGQDAAPYFSLEIERERFAEDALEKIATIPESEFRKEMRIVFIGEEAYDSGGVRKEFFQLLSRELLEMRNDAFIGIEQGRFAWFNQLYGNYGLYRSVGILMGLAIYNGDLFDLRFPPVIYRKLLGQEVGLVDLEVVDSGLFSGFQKLLNFDESEGLIEDIFCHTFEAVTQLPYGGFVRHALIPNGGEVMVTKTNREDFVERYVHWVLEESIFEQFGLFSEGFNQVVATTSLHLLRPEELEMIICGSPELNFKELEAITEYEGGFARDHPTIENFWSIVNSDFDEDKQRRLLMFSTGNTRAPIGGLGKLNFKIQRNGPDSDLLPTSHTCFNILMLPDYSTREKLKERLMISLMECEGFGLI